MVKVDVGSDESCKELIEQLSELQIDKVDLLINNAGIGSFDDLHASELTQNALEQFNVNALGPLRMTKALLPLLRNGVDAKVVNLSSKMSAFSSNLTGRYYGYRSSKAALNMISLNLAYDLQKDNIGCILLNPGLIRTGMNDNNGDMDADEAVEMMVDNVIERHGLGDGDKFFDRTGKVIEW